MDIFSDELNNFGSIGYEIGFKIGGPCNTWN